VVANLAFELQILAVLSWIALLLILQMAVWPALRSPLRDYAYPASFPVSLLAFTIISWYCGLLHLPVWLAVIPFLFLIGWFFWKGEYQRKYFAGQGKWALVFFVFFLFMLELRFVNPSISYAEKFMDHAFLASIMRVPVVPPLDPWFAGGTLGVYYYLGYWIFGALGLVTGIPSYVVFNLALPTVLANAAVAMYALAHLLCNRMRWLPLLTFLVVNPSFIWELIQGKALGSVLWDSTRTVPNAINEYPLFSFVWGDVHAHVISIFNQVILLFLLVYSLNRWKEAGEGERLALIVLTALSLGSVPLINTWDVILYAPLTVFVGYLLWYSSSVPGGVADEGIFGVLKQTFALLAKGERRKAKGPVLSRSWSYLLFVPLLSVALYLPYYLQMNSRGIQGIGVVHTPTPVTAFLLVNGIFIAIFLVYLTRDIVRKPLWLLTPVPFALAGYAAAGIAALPLAYLLLKKKRTPTELLAITGLLVIILAEFFYLKDNMGETYYRMNTVFKFYLPAWIIMGASAFSMVSLILEKPISRLRITKGVKEAALIAAIAILFILPLAVPLDYQYRDTTLDGLAYLDTTHPGDARAVQFLRSLQGVTGIVEAEGGDYTYYSRISSFTGIPAIIGMPFHEYMWRSEGWSGERTNDIRLIYEDPGQSRALMEKYGVNLLYVGDPERERYTVRVEEAGLPLIYNQSEVQIYFLSV
jgi:YYY domain-containing protein